MSCLVQTRLSRANAAQRAGRAGRVRAGFCFHLFMRRELQEMPPQQLPEMLRCPLESVCLRIKSLKLGFIRDFLSRAIEPPADGAIDHVIAVLAGLNALRSNDKAVAVNRAQVKDGAAAAGGGGGGGAAAAGAPADGSAGERAGEIGGEGEYRIEELTPLGTILASLPVDPRIGRMMIYGAIFRCLEPTLIIAASLAFRSPFFSPMDKRQEADRVKRSFHSDSDHLTLLRAYRGWERERRAGRTHERGFLFDNFLSGQTLRMIEKMKTQFKRLLQEVGFHDRRRERDYNENSNNQALVKAVLVAGLYPNIVRVQEGKKGPPKLKTRKMFEPVHDLGGGGGGGSGGGGGVGKGSGKGGGKKRKGKGKGGKGKDSAAAKPRPVTEEAVDLHPSSVLYGRSSLPERFLVYHEKVKTSAVFVRDATAVGPGSLLLFGGEVTV